MRKLLLLVAIAAAAMSCTKTNLEAPKDSNAQELNVSINVAPNSAKGDRIVVSDEYANGVYSYDVAWADGDKLGAWGADLENTASFTEFGMETFDAKNAVFNGTVSAETFPTQIRLVYPYDESAVITYGVFRADVSEQTFIYDDVNNAYAHLAEKTYMMSDLFAVGGEAVVEELDMKHLGATIDLKMTTAKLSGDGYTLDKIVVSSEELPTAVDINMNTAEVQDATFGAITVNVNDGNCPEGGKWKSVPINVFPFTLEAGKSITFSVYMSKEGKQYIAEKVVTVPATTEFAAGLRHIMNIEIESLKEYYGEETFASLDIMPEDVAKAFNLADGQGIYAGYSYSESEVVYLNFTKNGDDRRAASICDGGAGISVSKGAKFSIISEYEIVKIEFTGETSQLSANSGQFGSNEWNGSGNMVLFAANGEGTIIKGITVTYKTGGGAGDEIMAGFTGNLLNYSGNDEVITSVDFERDAAGEDDTKYVGFELEIPELIKYSEVTIENSNESDFTAVYYGNGYGSFNVWPNAVNETYEPRTATITVTIDGVKSELAVMQIPVLSSFSLSGGEGINGASGTFTKGYVTFEYSSVSSEEGDYAIYPGSDGYLRNVTPLKGVQQIVIYDDYNISNFCTILAGKTADDVTTPIGSVQEGHNHIFQMDGNTFFKLVNVSDWKALCTTLSFNIDEGVSFTGLNPDVVRFDSSNEGSQDVEIVGTNIGRAKDVYIVNSYETYFEVVYSKGNTSFRLRPKEENNTFNEREATITVTVDGVSHSLEVTQAAGRGRN